MWPWPFRNRESTFDVAVDSRGRSNRLITVSVNVTHPYDITELQGIASDNNPDHRFNAASYQALSEANFIDSVVMAVCNGWCWFVFYSRCMQCIITRGRWIIKSWPMYDNRITREELISQPNLILLMILDTPYLSCVYFRNGLQLPIVIVCVGLMLAWFLNSF